MQYSGGYSASMRPVRICSTHKENLIPYSFEQSLKGTEDTVLIIFLMGAAYPSMY